MAALTYSTYGILHSEKRLAAIEARLDRVEKALGLSLTQPKDEDYDAYPVPCEDRHQRDGVQLCSETRPTP